MAARFTARSGDYQDVIVHNLVVLDLRCLHYPYWVPLTIRQSRDPVETTKRRWHLLRQWSAGADCDCVVAGPDAVDVLAEFRGELEPA